MTRPLRMGRGRASPTPAAAAPGRRTARLAALVPGAFVPAALVLAGAVGCATDDASTRLAERLIASERLRFEARERDLDAALVFAERADRALRAACAEAVAARIEALGARLDRARWALHARFDARAWALLVDDQPRLADRADAPIARRVDAAARALEEASAASASKPNDALLAAEVDAAAAELARFQLERLAAEVDGTWALAARIEVARARVGARIAAVTDALEAELRGLAASACTGDGAAAPGGLVARRADYARLHAVQIEGLATLRRRGDPEGVSASVASAVGEALRDPPAWRRPTPPLDPAVAAEIDRAAVRIDRAERELDDLIDARFEALRADLESGA